MNKAANPREKRRLVLLIVLLAAAGGAAALTYWPSGDPARDADVPVGPGRASGPRAAAFDLGDLPELKLDRDRGAMQGEVGRNVFRFYDSPTPTRTPIPPTPTAVVYQGPPAVTPIPPTPTITPIIPPNIPYKAIGVFGPKERLIVVLEDGSRLINAREKDTLDNRFIVWKINRESIDFSFVGLPPEITRRIPVP